MNYDRRWFYIEIYKKEIEKLGQNINQEGNYIEIINTMKQIYMYLKKVCSKFYDSPTNKMHVSYTFLIDDVYRVRNQIYPSYYIVPNTYNYKYNKNFITPTSINCYSEEEILNLLVHETYKEYEKQVCKNFTLLFDRYDFTNKCEIMSKLMKKICDKYGITCKIIKIEAGFSNSKANLYNGSGFHYFNIIKFENKEYIVDISYRQFFLIRDNILESLGVPELFNPKPGCYMLLNKEREKVAKKILKKGYILLTPNNLKNYLDGFTLSFRNGLYYEQNGISYTTPYTYEQYLDFLYTDASLTDYEDKSLLGYQKRPLNNPNFEFNKR